jgi:hypothetical protein
MEHFAEIVVRFECAVTVGFHLKEQGVVLDRTLTIQRTTIEFFNYKMDNFCIPVRRDVGKTGY